MRSTTSAVRHEIVTDLGSDGMHHFEADLTFGGCHDEQCPTGWVEPTVDMS